MHRFPERRVRLQGRGELVNRPGLVGDGHQLDRRRGGAPEGRERVGARLAGDHQGPRQVFDGLVLFRVALRHLRLAGAELHLGGLDRTLRLGVGALRACKGGEARRDQADVNHFRGSQDGGAGFRSILCFHDLLSVKRVGCWCVRFVNHVGVHRLSAAAAELAVDPRGRPAFRIRRRPCKLSVVHGRAACGRVSCCQGQRRTRARWRRVREWAESGRRTGLSRVGAASDAGEALHSMYRRHRRTVCRWNWKRGTHISSAGTGFPSWGKPTSGAWNECPPWGKARRRGWDRVSPLGEADFRRLERVSPMGGGPSQWLGCGSPKEPRAFQGLRSAGRIVWDGEPPVEPLGGIVAPATCPRERGERGPRNTRQGWILACGGMTNAHGIRQFQWAGQRVPAKLAVCRRGVHGRGLHGDAVPARAGPRGH